MAKHTSLPPRSKGLRGVRPQLEVHQWVASQVVDKGYPIRELVAEYQRRRLIETGYEAVDPLRSIRAAVTIYLKIRARNEELEAQKKID